MKAIDYVRYSCDNQTEASIEGQLRDCKAFAERNGYEIIEHYIDRAYTATNDQRPEFQRMIRDSKKGIFDTVIVWKFDRFSRSIYDSAHYEQILKKNGVKVVSVMEPILETSAGILMKSMLIGMAEYYSADLSEKVSRGMMGNALRGESCGGATPYGYVRIDKKFVIDTISAEYVKMIFDMYDRGETTRTIATELNAANQRTSMGNRFQPSSVVKILRNRKYTGLYESHGVVIQDGIPRIIEDEQFERIQQKLKTNRKYAARNKAKVDYLLSGKVTCGECESNIVGECGTSKTGAVHHYYKCLNHKRGRGCKLPAIRKDALENVVVAETIRSILNPDRQAYLARRCIELYNCRPDQESQRLKVVKLQLKEINKEIKNLMEAIKQGVITRTIQSELLELEQAQDKLSLDIEKLKIQCPLISEGLILQTLGQFCNNEQILTAEAIKNILRFFVHTVQVFDDRLIITYYLLENTIRQMKSELFEPDFIKKKLNRGFGF